MLHFGDYVVKVVGRLLSSVSGLSNICPELSRIVPKYFCIADAQQRTDVFLKGSSWLPIYRIVKDRRDGGVDPTEACLSYQLRGGQSRHSITFGEQTKVFGVGVCGRAATVCSSWQKESQGVLITILAIFFLILRLPE